MARRTRFTELEIKQLLNIKWWEKSKEWIKDNIALFENIKDFTSFTCGNEDKYENL